ncbi:UNVERIFIED_CONTAM: hypothetical protein Sradi_0931800 [Sesamum radiatum]|uniref:Uncharacterized protein n=1 Tax=Sesamum radiatum TaxID=300843 RepID=A0AAW2V2M4_SESRA
MASTNITSVTPTKNMHVSENEQKALSSLSIAPPKLLLDSLEPIQMEASITYMETFTKVESYVGDVKLYLNPDGM